MKKHVVYITKEFIPPLVLGIAVFTFVLLLDKIFDFVDLYLNKGVHFFTILKLLALILPSMLSLTIPMGFLLGTLLAFGRLSEDGEITAWRASGQHLFRIIWPPLLLAVFAAAYLVYFNTTLAPRAQNGFRSLYREVLQQNPLVKLTDKTFLEVMNFRIYVDHKDPSSGVITGVHIYRIEDQSPPTRIYAQTGIAEVILPQGIFFHLYDGIIQQMDPLLPERTTITSFNKYNLQIPFEKQDQNIRKNLRSMSTAEIRREIKTYQSQDLPVHYLTTEFHLRYAIAFASIAFALIGSVLGIKIDKGGRSIGFALSLLIIFIYYLMLIGGITLSEKGFLFHWLDIWFCNITTMCVGGILLARLLKR
jgi:lipopolysaccharide export system permease protein